MNSHPPFVHQESEIRDIQLKLASLEPGTIIPNGRVIEEIGSGGFGTVYKVETTEGIKAYKVYHATELHVREKVKAFKRGYHAMIALNGHSNIVRVQELTQAPLGFFMDYISGTNLRSWWTDDIEKQLIVLHSVAQTLEHAHSHPRTIVHRDIKPENILIVEGENARPIPYLTDFDLSWYSMATVYSTTGQSAVAAFGHILYAAPEQYERPGDDITRKPTTDVFAFGQLCYFTISGKDPATLAEFSIDNLKALLSRWDSEDAAQKFLELYKKCIQRTPSNRYQNMNEVSAALLSVRNSLLDPDHTKELNKDAFIAELIFGIFGFDVEPSVVTPKSWTRKCLCLC